MPTYNIICFGTGESSSQARRTILHEIKDQLPSDRTLCCEGVTWNARKSFMFHEKQKAAQIISEDKENDITTYRQVNSEVQIKPGKDAVVDKGVQQIFDWLQQNKPFTEDKLVINFMGFSRGGTFPLRIINEFNKRYPEYMDLIQCNVLAIDPVAGFGDKGHDSVKTIPRNINEYLSTIHLHENRGGFEAQDISRLTQIETPMTSKVTLLPLPGRHAGITQFSAHAKVGATELNKSAELLWEIVTDFYNTHSDDIVVPKKTFISRSDKDVYSVKREQFSRLSPINIATNYDFLSHKDSEARLQEEALRVKKANAGFLPQKARAAKERLHEYVADSEYFTNLHHRRAYSQAYPELFTVLFKQQMDEQTNLIDDLKAMPMISREKLVDYIQQKYGVLFALSPSDAHLQKMEQFLIKTIQPRQIILEEASLQRTSSLSSLKSNASFPESIVNLSIDEVKQSASQKLMLQIRLALNHYKTDTQLGQGRYVKQCQPLYDQMLALSRSAMSEQEKVCAMMNLCIGLVKVLQQGNFLSDHEKIMIKTLSVTLSQDRIKFSSEHGIQIPKELGDKIDSLHNLCAKSSFKSTAHHYVNLNEEQDKTPLSVIADKIIESIISYKEAKEKTWDKKSIKYLCEQSITYIKSKFNEKNDFQSSGVLKQVCSVLQTSIGTSGSLEKREFRKKIDLLLDKINNYEALTTKENAPENMSRTLNQSSGPTVFR